MQWTNGRLPERIYMREEDYIRSTITREREPATAAGVLPESTPRWYPRPTPLGSVPQNPSTLDSPLTESTREEVSRAEGERKERKGDTERCEKEREKAECNDRVKKTLQRPKPWDNIK